MTFTFRAAGAGGWLAFVATPRLLLVEGPDDAFTASAWDAVRAADGFQASLDLLTGKGLAATPAFVLVEWEQGSAARAIVRGSTVLHLAGPDGPHELSGAGASTWAERKFDAVDSLAFEIEGATAVSGELPLERGVVPVASVRTSGAPAVAAAAPAKAAAPVKPAAKAAPVTADPPKAAAPKAAPVAAAPAAPPASPAPPAPPIEVDIGATVREAPESVKAAEPVKAAESAKAADFTPPPANGYHDLFGETVFRDVSDAVVREAEPEGDAPVVDDTLHDGETVMLSDIAKARGPRASRKTPDAPPAPHGVVLVISPSGAREPLVQPVLVGRSPSVSKVSGGQIPRLITIGTADQDISRNHAQFTLEGDTVVVTDLHSRNGTTITLPDKPSQKLRAGEPTSVIIGTVVDFGGGVTLTVEKDS